MRIRYQADADLNRTIVLAVARLEPAIDFQTAHAAGLEGADDANVLELAAATGRILVTHDRRTMPQHFAEFLTGSQNRTADGTPSGRGRRRPRNEPKAKVVDLLEALKVTLGDGLKSAPPDCPGVLIVPQKLPVAVAAEELVLIWALTQAEDWVNRICAIPL